jgi:hypothetical protein
MCGASKGYTGDFFQDAGKPDLPEKFQPELHLS